ncbi:MAG TPA: helix-turn-helix domain-containing protein [Terracidiphilus sp.]
MTSKSTTGRMRSLPEAAEQLGLSVKCLRGWIYRREIPYFKLGRAVRISNETIERIITAGAVPAREQSK